MKWPLNCFVLYILMVPDQNGISQACCIITIYHSGLEPSVLLHVLNFFIPVGHPGTVSGTRLLHDTGGGDACPCPCSSPHVPREASHCCGAGWNQDQAATHATRTVSALQSDGLTQVNGYPACGDIISVTRKKKCDKEEEKYIKEKIFMVW